MSFPPNLGITNSIILIDSTSSSLFQDFSSLLPPLESISSPFSRNRMNGYSRIRNSNTARSKSVDFADLSFPHHTPNLCSKSEFRSHEARPNARKITTVHASIPENEHEGSGEVFGIVLGRKCAVSAAPSDRKVAVEKECSALQTAPMRSLSIKRSTSVSEGYSRIHHQDFTAEDDDDDPCRTELISQNKCVKKKKGKFLKAFKRLFGL